MLFAKHSSPSTGTVLHQYGADGVLWGGDNPLLEMMPSAACDYRIKVIPIENSGLPQPIKPVILAASGTNHGKKNQRAFGWCGCRVAKPSESTIQKHQFSTELKSGVFSPRLTAASQI